MATETPREKTKSAPYFPTETKVAFAVGLPVYLAIYLGLWIFGWQDTRWGSNINLLGGLSAGWYAADVCRKSAARRTEKQAEQRSSNWLKKEVPGIGPARKRNDEKVGDRSGKSKIDVDIGDGRSA
jgi:hypothetical protein